MTTHEQGCILACIDGSELGNSVVEHAIWLAQTSQLPIKFLHTIEHSHHSENAHHEGTITPNMKEHLLDELSDEERLESKKLIADGKAILANAKQKAEQAGLSNIIAKQRHGSLSETLVDLKDEISLVVLGAKGEDHDGNKQGLGSQLEEAIRAIHSPIFIVKDAFGQPKKMMLAYNGSPTSQQALNQIKQGQLGDLDLELHIVSVHKEQAQAQTLIDEANTFLANTELRLVTRAIEGETVEELTQYQHHNQIDITTMGAFSHGKVHGFFFGSFTTEMLLECSTHFLLIRE